MRERSKSKINFATVYLEAVATFIAIDCMVLVMHQCLHVMPCHISCLSVKEYFESYTRVTMTSEVAANGKLYP